MAAFIPPVLLSATRKAEFIAWLNDLAILNAAKRQTLDFWAQQTGTTLTDEDYRMVDPTGTPPA
jgi:hypothetical protein